jgi:hypothetical protein
MRRLVLCNQLKMPYPLTDETLEALRVYLREAKATPSEKIWTEKRGVKGSHTLLQWLDYSGKLTAQSPPASLLGSI